MQFLTILAAIDKPFSSVDLYMPRVGIIIYKFSGA